MIIPSTVPISKPRATQLRALTGINGSSGELVDSIASDVIGAKLLSSCHLRGKVDKCKSRFDYTANIHAP